ncbi:carboxymuconolactone decarboxylase family protein [Pseudomonas sp. DP16D-R1]|jgi:alkylhydroperoxidase family enzyme|uniref:carboxymuconolactone decarboxylase family protein n=1 Tax=Pseudomonas sp. DP16D-R1 TaxID=2075551 RepID=UPI000CD181E3|nr:carboxymuconolactone decarboxylase family protein [Pseudomonas sp. DP16D-R1]POA77462.1 carboxymuconolactone decarboxylase [Pseudomonas sp. DP16D-R1]
MKSFKLHDQSSAPEAAKPLLEDSMKSFGMIPGLHAVMAEAPGVLDAYKKLHALFLHTSFDADEKTVVWQSINVEHGCHYCVPAHTGIAKSMKVSDEVTNALRDETPLPNDRLEALRSFTLAVVRNRGEVADADLEAFYAASYEQHHVLEVILGVSQKIMSNYINHIAKTPVDKPFMQFEWKKVQK